MSEKYDLILESVFGIDINQDTSEIIKGLDDKITDEKEFQSEVYVDDTNKEVIINYTPKQKEDKITNLCIAAGLLNPEFDRAEKVYRMEVEESGKDYKYTLQGYSLGGAFSQYAAIMSEGYIQNYQVINYNSLGIESFLEFRGNEFLGYKIGLLYYLNSIFYDDDSMEVILVELIDKGVIKDANISSEYRKEFGQKLRAEKLKKVLTEILNDKLELEEEKVEKLVEENFNPRIIERKMRFIDKYKEYQATNKNNIINYIISDNIPARIFKHIGATYLVDQNLKNFSGGLDEELINRIENLEEEQLDKLLEARVDLFEPYMLLAEGANGKSAKNRFFKQPKIGNITNNVSFDYLRSIIKDIIVDLNSKDKEILPEVFRLSRRGTGKEFLKIIKDRLHHSMYLQKKISEYELKYECTFFQENPDLLTDDDKVYRLDQAVLEQLERRMKYLEVKDLWKWELTGEGVFLNLGKEQEDDEEVKEYHRSYSAEKFTNEEKRLKIDLQEPSLNRIYGSLKQHRYLAKYDSDYLVEDDDLYQFPANQGVGFEILSEHTELKRAVEVDGQDISGTYNEKDREEADIGDRRKTLRYKYFGDNIILEDDYKLIYLYGANKENELIIDGFKNGDYGINLVEKTQEVEETQVPLTYTPHQVKFDNFEFIVLKKFELQRSIYDHSKVVIEGMIREDDFADYQRYLEKEDPQLVITYDNDDSKILFKGIIEDYSIGYSGYDYHLNIHALSYSVLLQRKRINRIYQNLGTTYNQVFGKLMNQSPEFNIACVDGSIGGTELVSEDYPLVLQYKENEWDFIKRISSYLNKLLIVDDTKDDSEKINIQLGAHNLPAKKLNNIRGRRMKKIGERFNQFYYYKIDKHAHFRSENIFDIGRKVKYNVNNEKNHTLQLIIIKNRIYMEKGMLYSDLTLVNPEDINLEKELRERAIKGRSFRAEIQQVNNKHKAQVLFKDLEDEYDESTSFWFPIDKLYATAYLAPDLGDIVDIYFKGKNEKYATIKSSSIDKEDEIENEATDKLLFTPEGYQMKLNNEQVLFAGKDNKSALQVKEEEVNLVSTNSQIQINKEEISGTKEKAQFSINNQQTVFKFGSKNVVIDSNGISIL